MLITNEFDDYEIISMSDGEKLERWGKFYLLRPDPEIIWKESLDKSIIHAYYHRSTTGGGYWDVLKKLPSSWCVNYKDLTFNVKLMGFKHTGIFPEQSVNWDFMREKIKAEKKKKMQLSWNNCAVSLPAPILPFTTFPFRATMSWK